MQQLGLIIITISIGLSILVFFHLLTHAFFKALLFTCAGGIIHSMGDNRDFRFMGGLSIYMRSTSSGLLVSNYALYGISLLAVFYFKDFILEIFFYEIYEYVWFFIIYVYGFNL